MYHLLNARADIPKDDPYLKALHSILNDEEKDKYEYAYNIGIIGSYGAGKSSVWRSYEKHYGISSETITISLANFVLDNKNNTEQGNNENKINQIERKIINQLVAHIPSKNIPLSSYKFKENQSPYLLTFSVILMVMYVLLLNFSDHKLDLTLLFLLFFTPFLYRFLNKFFSKERFNISKINVKGIEISKEEKQQQTVFDREIRDIIYAIENSNAKYIVFEDLDRFDEISLSVFDQLRELNHIVNARLKAKDKTIKFIYMLKDSLFHNGADRTKFFDAMISIIPVADCNNADSILFEYLENELKEESIKISKKAIFIIGHYISDMRQIYSIVNDFKIHSEKMACNELDLDKLFSIIALKNIYPKEFDELRGNTGVIYDLIKGKSNVQTNQNLDRLISTLMNKKLLDKGYGRYLSIMKDNVLDDNDHQFIQEVLAEKINNYLFHNISDCDAVLNKIKIMNEKDSELNIEIYPNKDLFEFSIKSINSSYSENIYTDYLDIFSEKLQQTDIKTTDGHKYLTEITKMLSVIYDKNKELVENYIKYMIDCGCSGYLSEVISIINRLLYVGNNNFMYVIINSIPNNDKMPFFFSSLHMKGDKKIEDEELSISRINENKVYIIRHCLEQSNKNNNTSNLDYFIKDLDRFYPYLDNILDGLDISQEYRDKIMKEKKQRQEELFRSTKEKQRHQEELLNPYKGIQQFNKTMQQVREYYESNNKRIQQIQQFNKTMQQVKEYYKSHTEL